MSGASEHIVIVGAGAAGLIAARELARAAKKVTILEARDRCGGRIQPLPASQFGYAAEGGAEFVHGEAPITRGLLREAGLSLQAIEGAQWSFDGTKLLREQRANQDRGRVGHRVAPGVVVHRRDDHALRRLGGRTARAVRDQRGRRPVGGGRFQGERRRPRAAVVRDPDADAAALRVLGRVERLAGHDLRRPVATQGLVRQRRDRQRAVLGRAAPDDRHRLAAADRRGQVGQTVGRRFEHLPRQRLWIAIAPRTQQFSDLFWRRRSHRPPL